MGAKKRKRIPWGWVWAVVFVTAGAAYGFWYQRTVLAAADKLPEGVQTGKAESGVIAQKITATGVVAAQTGAKVNIGTQISGRIASLPADVGATVRAGQVVAVVEVTDIEAQVEQQQQSVDAARAALAQAETRLNQANLNVRLTEEQNDAQIKEAGFAVRSAEERLHVAEAAAKLQPTQTDAEIARAGASLSTAKAQERQVHQTVRQQIAQARASVDEARAGMENARLLLQRQQSLLGQGFISRQEVDNSRTAYLQAAARMRTAEASVDIVREKTDADIDTAKNRVAEAEAALNAARAATLQNTMRDAEQRSALETKRQAEASLALRRSNRTQDVIRKSAVNEATSAVRQARATLRQAEAQLRFQKVQLGRAVIRSPITGTVLTIATQQGETVAAGFATPTLITVADLNRLEIRAYVDEVDIGKARVGLPAEVRVETYPGRIFRGRVSKIAGSSTVKDNVVTYETTIAIDNPGGLLRPDMTADVTLVLGRTSDILIIPTEAVHREVDRTVVYVLHREKKGKERVEERAVTTGVSDGSHTQIVTGLKENEEVVLAGLQRLGVKAVDAQNAEGKKE